MESTNNTGNCGNNVGGQHIAEEDVVTNSLSFLKRFDHFVLEHKFGNTRLEYDGKEIECFPEINIEDYHAFFCWFEKFENIMGRKRLPKKAICIMLHRFIPLGYQGVLYDIASNDGIENFEHLLIALTKKFFTRNDADTLLMEFLRSGPCETADEALDEFFTSCGEFLIIYKAVKKPFPISEWLCIMVLLEMLPRSFRRNVDEKELKKGTLENAYDYIQRLNRDIKYYTSMESSDAEYTNNTYEKYPGYIPPKVICHCCGVRGHKRPQCPHKNVTCYNCKKKGHMANMCRCPINVKSYDATKCSMRYTKKYMDKIFNQYGIRKACLEMSTEYVINNSEEK